MKDWRSQNFDFLGKNFWRNALALKSKKVQGIFAETFILTLSFSAVLVCKSVSQICLVCLTQVIKGFHQSSLCWFHGHNQRFTKYLGQNLKIPKTETQLCRSKSNDYNDSNIFLTLENRFTFMLVKQKTWKNIFNTNNKLSQDLTQKPIMIFKTTVNRINLWRYLIICCFDWNTGVFQQTVVVRVYYIFKDDIEK